LADQTGEHHTSRRISSATPGINQHSLLGRQTPPKKEIEQQTANCNLLHSRRGGTPESAWGKWEREMAEVQGANLHELSINKHCKGRKINNGRVINHSLKQGK
jgi:hypothetical protein